MGSSQSTPSAAATSSVAPVEAAGRDAVRVERDLARWKSFLHEEDVRCDEHHLAAALATVGLHRAADLDAACRVLDGALRPTDRIGVLCADEMSVLLAPLQDIRDAQRLVRALDDALRAAGIDVHVGWAMRASGHGFFHAAALADAAMLTAKGHGHQHIDLSTR